MFTMNGPAVYRMAVRKLPQFLERFFNQIGWERSDAEAIVAHQASLHGVRMLTDRLGFCRQQVLTNLETRGNCGAASIPLLFSEAVHAGRIQRGQKILLAGTGAGLSMGITALTF